LRKRQRTSAGLNTAELFAPRGAPNKSVSVRAQKHPSGPTTCLLFNNLKYTKESKLANSYHSEFTVTGPAVKRLIPAQRFEDEGLDFIEEHTVDDQGVTHVSYKIMDETGIAYAGLLRRDGAVFDGYTTYDCADTFERFKGPANTLCGWR
jgi:hypothetical protein